MKRDKRYIILFLQELKDKVQDSMLPLNKYDKYLPENLQNRHIIKYKKDFIQDFIEEIDQWETKEYSVKNYLTWLYQKYNDELREITKEILAFERFKAAENQMFEFYLRIRDIIKAKLVFLDKLIIYIEKGGEVDL